MAVLSAVGHPSVFGEVISKKSIKPTIFHALCTAFQFKLFKCVKNFQRMAKHVHHKAVWWQNSPASSSPCKLVLSVAKGQRVAQHWPVKQSASKVEYIALGSIWTALIIADPLVPRGTHIAGNLWKQSARFRWEIFLWNSTLVQNESVFR
jgi:hypothetical protein